MSKLKSKVQQSRCGLHSPVPPPWRTLVHKEAVRCWSFPVHAGLEGIDRAWLHNSSVTHSNSEKMTPQVHTTFFTIGCYDPGGYYAALLPRRGPHIASHSVCPSVCLSVCPSVPLSLPSVTSRHLTNYNDTHVLFGTHWGPHIVRPSRPHKFLFTPGGTYGALTHTHPNCAPPLGMCVYCSSGVLHSVLSVGF